MYSDEEPVVFPFRFERGYLFLQLYHVQFLVLLAVRVLSTNQAIAHFDFALL